MVCDPRGKQTRKGTIGDIVEAQSSLGGGARNSEVEGRFWVALRELAAAVQPASVNSILATYSYPFGDHGKSGKRRVGEMRHQPRKSIAGLQSPYWCVC